MISLLSLPQLQVFTADGVPAASGTIGQFIPGTLTPKVSWSDPDGISANLNPLTLDGGGMASLYGDGVYRLIVKDASGNLIMDGESAAYLPSDAISDTMAPAVSADTFQSFRDISGVTAAISAAVSAVSLITGPVGPAGASITGPTGPTGPAGSASAPSRQTFGVSGTWTKPATGSIAIIQLFGAGGAGTNLSGGGGGGGGGYSAVMCLLSDLSASVAVTIGNGGAYDSGAVPGASGGTTAFGSYLVQAGGCGGNLDTGTGLPVTGSSGYLLSSSGLTIIFGSSQNYTVAASDNYGNFYNSSPFAGSSGAATGSAFPAIFGGSGGAATLSGGTPGGGGGFGGSGGNGYAIITCL